MVDRPIVYVGELPRAEDFLGSAKDTLVGVGYLAQAAIGPNVGVAGFAIAPTGPASLSFTIGTGSIYASATVDATAYGVLGTDANTIIKQGILSSPATLTVTPPATSGFSQVYIVQVGYSDVDTGAIVPPYYNSANPNLPFNGAGGGGGSQNTIRQGQAVIQLKAGTAAATGSQTTPTADPGFVALWAITVANGATTITSANWTQQSATPYSAPWFPNLESLTSIFQQIIPQTTFYVDRAIGSDTLYDGTSATINGNKGPWATIGHAVTALSAYNLNGNTVTIQLGATGSYSGVLNIAAPSSGILVINGNTSAQSTYTITGAPTGQNAVVNITSGTVNLSGLVVQNTSSGTGTTAVRAANATLNLTNVTLTATITGTQALSSAGIGASINFQAGCICASSGVPWQSALFAQNGGTIAQNANIATSGSPAVTGAWALAQVLGVIGVAPGLGITWTGSGATGPRYSSTLGSVINTNGGGANFFPGNSVGSAPTGYYA